MKHNNWPGWVWWAGAIFIIGGLLIWRPGRAETVPEWSYYWYPATGGEPPGCVLLVGKYQSELLRRDEWKTVFPLSGCGRIRFEIIKTLNAVSRNKGYGPINISNFGGELEPLTDCDMALLWAQDEGARAPEMTRARKLQQAGCPASLP